MSGAAGFGMLFYFPNSAALTNATITYTKQTSGRISSISAFYVTGIATTTPLDTAVTAGSAVNSATPTVTSGVPTQSGNIVIGACAYSNAAAKTLTNTGSFVTPFANNTTSATASCGGGHLNVGGSLAQVFTPTLSGASDNRTMIVGFQPAVATPVGWWNVTKWAASTTKVAGNLIRQNATPNLNAERVFVCIASTSGTGTTAASEPSWTTTAQCTRGAKFTDNTVTWQEATGVAALNGDVTNTPTWTQYRTANAAAVLGQIIKSGDGTKILINTTAGNMAALGSEPTWATFTNAGATTADGAAAVWTTIAAVPSGFANWAAPHARMTAACTATWGAAGNNFYVASNHAEAQASTNSITIPSSSTVESFVYCVNQAGAVPPVAATLTTGGSIATTGNVALNVLGTRFYIDGLTLSCGSGVATANLTTCNTNTSQSRWKNMSFVLGGSGSQQWALAGTNTNNQYENCTIQFGSTTSGIMTGIAASGSQIIWKNTLSAIVGSVPTNLFGGTVNLLVQGVDLSALGSGKTLANAFAGMLTLQDCKLGASVTKSNTPSIQGNVDIIRCDSAATNYIHERYQYCGTQVVETTIVRTGGASDGTTTISWKITATANSTWTIPFFSMPITLWCNTTGSHTVTIFGTTTGGGVPNNDDIWIEVEYLGDASSPQGSFATTTKATNLTASATTNNSSDASTWGGGGAGNGFKMVTPAFTVNQIGYITVTIKVAKVSATYYVDPLITLS